MLFDLIGTISNPIATQYGDYPAATVFLSNVIRLVTVVAGLFTMINFLVAGIGFIGAGGNPQAVESAWKKIYQSLIGMSVVALTFVIAGILGLLLYGNAGAILNPTITGPGS